jgi:hypothetical protein
MYRTPCQVVACVAALMLFPSISGAQPPATSFEELLPLLRPGQEVIVVHADGRRTRERVLAVTSSSLEMQSKSLLRYRAPGPRTSYSESAITSILLVDSVWQGALIGYAAGFGVGVARCRADDDCLHGDLVAPLLITLAGGAIGATVDAAIRKTVYLNGTLRPAGRATIGVSPLVAPRTTGVSVSLKF